MNVILSENRPRVVPQSHLYPVILCGGSGTRLWPLSRQAYPKQLLPLLSDRTMLQETVMRSREALGLDAPLILCNEDHRFMVAEQLSEIGVIPSGIICEPVSRNTAPALCAAAQWLYEQDPEARMLTLPSDHHIGDPAGFAEAVRLAGSIATDDRLVVFGVRPTRPEVGYGYIKRGDLYNGAEAAFHLEKFVEKPDRKTAERLMADGAHFWNSGMFLLPVASFMEELDRYGPDISAAAKAAVRDRRDGDGFILLDRASFAASPDASIDYAVMEHTNRGAMVPIDIGWSDVGSWPALHGIKDCDECGNVIQGDVITDDVHDSYIRADNRLVAVLGIRDAVIVDTEDALFVSDAEHAAQVGRMVERLSTDKRPEMQHHRRVYRPWGFYQTIGLGGRHQVKHLMVKPGAQLSLQMHHHRAEHWVVVGGTGLVTCGERKLLLSENQSVEIPLGGAHRLENPGKIPLHVIEVQIGSYLGEDDIVRFEDTYGRA